MKVSGLEQEMLTNVFAGLILLTVQFWGIDNYGCCFMLLSFLLAQLKLDDLRHDAGHKKMFRAWTVFNFLNCEKVLLQLSLCLR